MLTPRSRVLAVSSESNSLARFSAPSRASTEEESVEEEDSRVAAARCRATYSKDRIEASAHEGIWSRFYLNSKSNNFCQEHVDFSWS
jgi:hypothetical protein